MNLQQLNALINQSTSDTGFSGVISLTQNSEQIFNFTKGFSNRASQQQNDINTSFGVASITKFFTSLAIIKFIERGSISLDMPLGDAISTSLPTYAQQATFKQLLTHTSGIPDYYDESLIKADGTYNLSIPWHKLRCPTDYIPILPNQPSKFPAGERFDYNNSGYILLGIALEALSGKLFSNVIQTEIIAPLHLQNTGFYPFDNLPPNTAIGYTENANGNHQTNQNALPFIGASDGGIYTNIADLTTLWQSFWAGNIVCQSSIKSITQPHVKRDPKDNSKHYGLGIYIKQTNAHTEKYFLQGRDVGVSAYTGYHPASNHQITIISNNAKGLSPLLKILENTLNRLQKPTE